MDLNTEMGYLPTRKLENPPQKSTKNNVPQGIHVWGIYIYLHFVDCHGINAGKWILNGSTPHPACQSQMKV